MTSTPCTLAGTSSWSLIFCFLFPAKEAERAPNPACPVQTRGSFLLNIYPQTSCFYSSYTARAFQGLRVAIVRGDGASLPKRWTLGFEENQNLGGFIFGFDWEDLMHRFSSCCSNGSWCSKMHQTSISQSNWQFGEAGIWEYVEDKFRIIKMIKLHEEHLEKDK